LRDLGGILSHKFAAGIDKNRSFSRRYLLDPITLAVIVVFADRGSVRVFYFRLLVVAVKSGLPGLICNRISVPGDVPVLVIDEAGRCETISIRVN
jgi:hypothetical protein